MHVSNSIPNLTWVVEGSGWGVHGHMGLAGIGGIGQGMSISEYDLIYIIYIYMH